MKRLFVISFVIIIVGGCAGMVMDYTPYKASNGGNGYYIETVYGLIVDGTLDQARNELRKEANRLCPSGYTFISEQKHPRKTKWGAENGQIDLIWDVTCNTR